MRLNVTLVMLRAKVAVPKMIKSGGGHHELRWIAGTLPRW